MNPELEKMWKETVTSFFWYYYKICIYGTEEIHESF
jgi:hypothetical protein